MIKLSSLKRNKRIVKSDHHVCIHLTISPRNESSVSGLRARRKRRFHGWLRRIETMSLGSSRRFNGGQIEREGKREREKKKRTSRFAFSSTAVTPSFSPSHAPSVLVSIVDGSRCSSRSHLLSKKQRKIGNGLRSVAMPLFRRFIRRLAAQRGAPRRRVTFT